jgi:hypothetical protein
MDPTSSPRPRHLRAVPDVYDPPTALIANFVYAVVHKLGRGGNPEDQLRGPLEILIEQVGQRYGLDAVPYGEVSLKNLRARPDYAVDIGRSRVGYHRAQASRPRNTARLEARQARERAVGEALRPAECHLQRRL